MGNSKPKFTPGPWVAPNEMGNLVLTKEDWTHGLYKGCMQIVITPCDTKQTEANAHLIAAAPEMYDALEVAAAELEQCEPNDEYPEMQMAYRNIMGQIKSALKKARGES